MPTEVVDDRVFAIGLTELFRAQMKSYEVRTLLPLAKSACAALGVPPARVPVEGYYAESPELTQYFKLVRALQSEAARPLPPGPAQRDLGRLRELYSAPALGRVEPSDRLLPRSSSPFGEALRQQAEWSVEGLAREARRLVRDSDAGLVAVAAATGDPVALVSARESVALAADVELADDARPTCVWAVSAAVVQVAERFVSALARATDLVLPRPGPGAAALYFAACRDAPLAGRCILIGERAAQPFPFYHWYVEGRAGAWRARDFWSSHLWSTDHLRALSAERWPPAGARVGAPPSVGAPPPGDAPPPGGDAALLPPGGRARDARPWYARLFKPRPGR